LSTVSTGQPGDSVIEDPVLPTDNSSDTLDFSGLSGGNGVGSGFKRARLPSGTTPGTGSFDLMYTGIHVGVVDTQLTLKLSSDTGVENVLGSPFTDNITGNTRNNRIEGRAGDADKLFGDDGNDTVDGGAGEEDCVHGEGGNDILYGGDGADDIGKNFLAGESHDPESRAETGADVLYGGPGNDRIGGESEDDTIYGDAGQDTDLEGGDGNDVIRGGTENDRIKGEAGDDIIYGESDSVGAGNAGTAHNDEIFGGTGADRIYGGDGDDTIEGGSENDTIYGDFVSLQSAHRATDEGDDTIRGDAGSDTIRGDSNNASWGWGRGNDNIKGGDGDDTLIGDGGQGSAYDTVSGSPTYGEGILGDDTLEGEQGTDHLAGENGGDTYRFEATDSELLGSDYVEDSFAIAHAAVGRDKLDFHELVPPTGFTGISVNISLSTTQVISGNPSSPQLSLRLSTSSSIEDVDGTDHDTRGDDTIIGNALGNILRGSFFDSSVGKDTIYGGGGNDVLWGMGGTDVLYGEAGNDQFETAGDPGSADILHGGTGTDTASLTNGDRDDDDTNPSGDIENWL